MKIIITISALVCVAVALVLLICAVIISIGNSNFFQASSGPDGGGEVVQIVLGILLLILLLIVSVAAYLLPTWIAIYRKHRFLGVIFVLNLAGGWSVLGWFVALGWAVWPSETVFSDVLTHDPTGLSAQRRPCNGRNPQRLRGGATVEVSYSVADVINSLAIRQRSVRYGCSWGNAGGPLRGR